MEINTKDFETREDATVIVNPRRTNGDARRSMSDEEMARLYAKACGESCPLYKNCHVTLADAACGSCENLILDWLQQPEEGKDGQRNGD